LGSRQAKSTAVRLTNEEGKNVFVYNLVIPDIDITPPFTAETIGNQKTQGFSPTLLRHSLFIHLGPSAAGQAKAR